ncbi:MAG: flagellar basal body L-ring protein FlgH [Pirellulaceae bacterium]|jgi:flagellar L-ring protein precursor FlgH|nr:flagellar basal body L-ring protein FlgH [Pirellulaceae bacterium]
MIPWSSRIRVLLLASAWSAAAALTHAQDSSLYSREAARWAKSPVAAAEDVEPEMTLGDTSWIYVPTPPPREIQKHDIISVRVDILARVQSDGELRRRKNGLYDARLNDWVIFDGLRWVKPSPQSDGDPRVRGELRSDYRTLGELQTSESLTFNIAAEVVDIRPNGNLVLEGRATARVNEEVWTVMLSGLCRPESIGPNNVVLSRDIINLNIRKVETGSVAAGYQRGWFQKIFDLIQPF